MSIRALVVDDEPIVRQVVKIALERAGRRVMLAEGGGKAIELFSQSPQEIDIVILDWKLPAIDGGDTLARLRAIRPDVKVIISSAFAEFEANERFSDKKITAYLQKPYKMADMNALVDKCLAIDDRRL